LIELDDVMVTGISSLRFATFRLSVWQKNTRRIT
jgi:hypothetical protein